MPQPLVTQKPCKYLFAGLLFFITLFSQNNISFIQHCYFFTKYGYDLHLSDLAHKFVAQLIYYEFAQQQFLLF